MCVRARVPCPCVPACGVTRVGKSRGVHMAAAPWHGDAACLCEREREREVEVRVHAGAEV